MFDLNPIQILASIPAIIIVFSVFGYAEAKVATWFGDPTPRMAGASHYLLWHTLI